MKKIFFITCFSFLFSCKSETKTEQPNDSLKNNLEQESPKFQKDYSNPFLIMGSDFGRFMQTLYKLGDFEKMLYFTHSSSIQKHGKQNIFNHYQEMEFGFEMKLQSHNKNDDGSITLNYQTNKMATKGIFRMIVKIENDTTKLVLPDELEKFP